MARRKTAAAAKTPKENAPAAAKPTIRVMIHGKGSASGYLITLRSLLVAAADYALNIVLVDYSTGQSAELAADVLRPKLTKLGWLIESAAVEDYPYELAEDYGGCDMLLETFGGVIITSALLDEMATACTPENPVHHAVKSYHYDARTGSAAMRDEVPVLNGYRTGVYHSTLSPSVLESTANWRELKSPVYVIDGMNAHTNSVGLLYTGGLPKDWKRIDPDTVLRYVDDESRKVIDAARIVVK